MRKFKVSGIFERAYLIYWGTFKYRGVTLLKIGAKLFKIDMCVFSSGEENKRSAEFQILGKFVRFLFLAVYTSFPFKYRRLSIRSITRIPSPLKRKWKKKIMYYVYRLTLNCKTACFIVFSPTMMRENYLKRRKGTPEVCKTA